MNERIPAYEGREPYIFVSYAHKNSNMVMPIIDSLYNDKYRVWYDEGIAPGSEWPKNIEDHLKAAAAVLVFISKESLMSLNCENEIANSKPDKRKVYQFSLDGSTHNKLKNCYNIKNYEDLKNCLDDILIGDGITGYKQEIGKAKKGNYWTGLIVFAIILFIALSVSLYGLYAGWFNNFLPGISEDTIEETSKQEVISTSNNILTQAIASSTNSQIIKTVSFESNEAKEYIYDLLEIEDDAIIKYQDLISNNSEELVLEMANDELLELMQYFSKLKSIIILDGNVSSLEPLLKCAYLETVKITNKLLPLDIPKDKLFEIEYIACEQ